MVSHWRRACLGLVVSGLLAGILLQTTDADATPLRWSITPSPNQALPNISSLDAVSCISPTSCVAVGDDTDVSDVVGQILIESWNGSVWRIVPSPSPGGTGGYGDLYGVFCTSSTDCVAVGSYGDGSPVQETLIESWNGSVWTVVSSPDPGSGSNVLDGVTCVSSTNCVAVGFDADASGVDDSLVESWNGSVWTVTSSPSPDSAANILDGVTCTGASNCVAVGFEVAASGVSDTLIETWNGSVWTVTPSPSPGSGDIELYAVSCTTASACVATGCDTNASGVQQTLVESWNGSAWSVTSSPSPGTVANFLSGVFCTSATSCVAVGLYADRRGVTLIETWNGMTWSITHNPNPATIDNGDGFSGVACATATACVAVGAYTDKAGYGQTLIETGASPPLAITAVTFTGSAARPEVTVTGTGFGTTPPSVAPGCGATGKDYAGDTLYLQDLTTGWNAGMPGDCVGLKVLSHSTTRITFKFGGWYASHTPTLAPGDTFLVGVDGVTTTGTVTYSSPS
jgi:hypothetical protein